VRVAQQDALAKLQDTAALWSIGAAPSTDVVGAACDCLVAGVDSPTLRILAGVSPSRGSENEELRLWLKDALDELSLTFYPEHSRQGEEAVLRIMARQLLDRAITPRELTTWAYIYITYAGTPLASELVYLESAYEYLDDVREYGNVAESEIQDLDARVFAEVRRLLGP
jgi:hypothetical protein